MTIPWMMNCPHDGDGWCLSCVRELAEEKDKLEKELSDLKRKVEEKENVRHCYVDNSGVLRDIKPGENGFSF
jgi:hypothetical protein